MVERGFCRVSDCNEELLFLGKAAYEVEKGLLSRQRLQRSGANISPILWDSGGK